MRGKPAPKRQLNNDPIYKSKLITRLTNYLMLHGKKSVAKEIVYTALDNIKTVKGVETPLSIVDEAFENVMPKQEIRSKRVGGANYQVPVHVKHDRAQALAIRWLLNAANNKKGVPMAKGLADAIIEAAEKRGDAIKKKEDVHRMADANKAFAHFRM